MHVSDSAEGRTVMERKIIYKRKKKEQNTDPFFLNGASNTKGVLMRFSMPSQEERRGPVTIKSSFSLPSVFAYVNPWGEIKTDFEEGQRIVEREQSKVAEDANKTTILRFGFFSCLLVFFFTTIFTLIFADNKWSAINLFGGTMICYALFKVPQYIRDLIARITEDEEFMKFTKFHAAEHRVINAYNILKRVPKFEELKDFSNHSYYCEYYNETSKAWMWIVVGICMQFMGTGFVWLIVLAMVAATIALEHFGYIPFGTVYVSEPDEIHLKTALTALEEATEIRKDAEAHLREVAGAMESMEIVFQMGKDEKGNAVPAGIIINIGCEPDEESDGDSDESKEN
jgi:hypothetical protein